MPDSLKAFYDEQAELAYSIEHGNAFPGGKERGLERFAKLQEEIAALEAAFAQTWRRPRIGAVALLPWCNVCGRADRALLPDSMLCSVCAAAQTQASVSQNETRSPE